MKKLDARGRINALLFPLLLMTLLFLSTAGFAVWAFGSRGDYKANTDQKIAVAVEAAKIQEAEIKENDFAEREKFPLKSYDGPEAYGSIHIEYPKVWSALVDEGTQQSKAATPIDGYFYPDFLPNITATSSATTIAYALRMQVTSTAYDQVLKTVSGNNSVTAGKIKISPFKAEKVPSVVGVRVEGEIVTGKTGVMIILPLRDKTVQLWTEAEQFKDDFNNKILPTLTFVP